MISKLIFITLYLFIITSSYRVKDSCINFDGENGCKGNQTDNDPSWLNRSFQTPPRGSALWREKYQDYNILVGYASVQYDNGRRSATIKLLTRLNPKYSNAQLSFFFNDQEQSTNTYQVNSSFKSLLKMKVLAFSNGNKIATL